MYDFDRLVKFTYENIQIEYSFEGEGLNGDYTPNDQNDIPLLRLSTSLIRGAENDEIEGGSICTIFPISTSSQTLEEFSKIVASELLNANFQGTRRVLERLVSLKFPKNIKKENVEFSNPVNI